MLNQQVVLDVYYIANTNKGVLGFSFCFATKSEWCSSKVRETWRKVQIMIKNNDSKALPLPTGVYVILTGRTYTLIQGIWIRRK